MKTLLNRASALRQLSRKSMLGMVTGAGLTLVTKGKEIVLIPAFSALLGIEGYGELLQVLLLSSILAVLATCGLDLSIISHPERSDDLREEMAISLTSLSLSFLAVAAAWVIASPFVSSALELDPSLALWLLPFSLLGTLRAMVVSHYRRGNKFGSVSVFAAMFDVVETAIVVALFFIGYAVSLQQLLVILVVCRTIAVAGALLEIRATPAPGHLRAAVMRLRYGIWFVPKEFIVWATHSADRIMIAGLYGPAAMAIYSAAYKLSSVVKFVSQPISFVSFPKLSNAWRSDHLSYRRILLKSLAGYGVCTFPLILVFIVAPDFILAMFNEGFRGYGYLLTPIALGLFVYTIQGISGYYTYVFAGKVRMYTARLSLVFVPGMVIQYVAIKHFGLAGAAYSSLALYLFFALVVLLGSKQILASHIRKGNQSPDPSLPRPDPAARSVRNASTVNRSPSATDTVG